MSGCTSPTRPCPNAGWRLRQTREDVLFAFAFLINEVLVRLERKVEYYAGARN
jgi:hypothetical protein